MRKKVGIVVAFVLAFVLGSSLQVYGVIYNGGKWRDPDNVRYLNNSTSYSSYVNTGALHYWNNYTSAINFVQINDANVYNKVLVKDVDIDDATWDGRATSWKTNGYFDKVEISLNKPNIEDSAGDIVNVRYRVVNHEFGHSVGLGDLYDDDEVLMYGITKDTPYYPTYTDLTRLNDLYN